MNNEQAKEVLLFIKDIQEQAYNIYRPPEDTGPSKSEQVIARSIVRKSRGYIEKIVHQINGAYEHGWFDACAVMIRRLVETLIIEVFEANGIDHKIKNANGNFFYLSVLIDTILAEKAFNLNRTAKESLQKLKDVGDQSAHSRRFIAQRKDIDDNIPHIRNIIQELLTIAKIKNFT